MKQIIPIEKDLYKEIIQILNDNPSFGKKRVYKNLVENHEDWILSEKRVTKLMKKKKLTKTNNETNNDNTNYLNGNKLNHEKIENVPEKNNTSFDFHEPLNGKISNGLESNQDMRKFENNQKEKEEQHEECVIVENNNQLEFNPKIIPTEDLEKISKNTANIIVDNLIENSLNKNTGNIEVEEASISKKNLKKQEFTEISKSINDLKIENVEEIMIKKEDIGNGMVDKNIDKIQENIDNISKTDAGTGSTEIIDEKNTIEKDELNKTIQNYAIPPKKFNVEPRNQSTSVDLVDEDKTTCGSGCVIV